MNETNTHNTDEYLYISYGDYLVVEFEKQNTDITNSVNSNDNIASKQELPNNDHCDGEEPCKKLEDNNIESTQELSNKNNDENNDDNKDKKYSIINKYGLSIILASFFGLAIGLIASKIEEE